MESAAVASVEEFWRFHISAEASRLLPVMMFLKYFVGKVSEGAVVDYFFLR